MRTDTEQGIACAMQCGEVQTSLPATGRLLESYACLVSVTRSNFTLGGSEGDVGSAVMAQTSLTIPFWKRPHRLRYSPGRLGSSIPISLAKVVPFSCA